MTCADVVPLLVSFLEHDLEPTQERGVLAHLQGCESCRDVEFELRASWAMLDSWPPLVPGADFVARVVQATRAEGVAAPRAVLRTGVWGRRRPWLAQLTTAAAVALVSVILFAPHNHPPLEYTNTAVVGPADELHDVLHAHGLVPQQEVLEQLINESEEI